MAFTPETGHAKNVANLLKLNQLVTTFGTTYNPSNIAIQPASLASLYSTGSAKLTAVNSAFTTWKNATNARQQAFEPLSKLSTQLLGSLQSLALSSRTIDDFEAQANKIRVSTSKSAKAKAEKTEATPLVNPVPETPETRTISTSQKSFDNKLQHFEKMIMILQSIPFYAPNEVPFQVATLEAQLINLHALNDAANTSYTNIKVARIERNMFFYNDATGLLDTVKSVKAYIKSIYGASSPQYLAATAIKFVRVLQK